MITSDTALMSKVCIPSLLAAECSTRGAHAATALGGRSILSSNDLQLSVTAPIIS